MQPRDPNSVKNKKELKKIPADKLFISESGYAYDTGQLIQYFKGKLRDIVVQMGWADGIFFQDFKNEKHRSEAGRARTLFSNNDIQELLKNPEINEVIMANKNFFKLVNLITKGFIKDETIKLLHNVSKASLIIESRMTSFWSEDLSKAISELIEHLNNNPSEKTKLKNLTGYGQPLESYIKGRSEDVIDDLQGVLRGRHCSSGFDREISFLYAALKSAQKYAEIFSLEEKQHLEEVSKPSDKEDEKAKLSGPLSPSKNISSTFSQKPDLQAIGLANQFDSWLNKQHQVFKDKIIKIDVVGDRFLIHTKNTIAEKYDVRDNLFKNKLKLNIENVDQEYCFYVNINDVAKLLNIQGNEQNIPGNPKK